MVTFACYRGNGCQCPGCRARGSIPNAMHSLSQARGSGEAVLDSPFPSKVGHLLMVTSNVCCVLLCTPSPHVLFHYGDAAGLNTSRNVKWAGLFHLGQHKGADTGIIFAHCLKHRLFYLCHTPREHQGSWARVSFVYWLVLTFLCSCSKSLTVIKRAGLFSDPSGRPSSSCFTWSSFLFRRHFCSPTSIAQDVFSLPIAAGSPNTPSAAHLICQGADFIPLGHYRQTLVLAFLSPAWDITALPWGSACEPWPQPGACVELPGLYVL